MYSRSKNTIFCTQTNWCATPTINISALILARWTQQPANQTKPPPQLTGHIHTYTQFPHSRCPYSDGTGQKSISGRNVLFSNLVCVCNIILNSQKSPWSNITCEWIGVVVSGYNAIQSVCIAYCRIQRNTRHGNEKAISLSSTPVKLHSTEEHTQLQCVSS